MKGVDTIARIRREFFIRGRPIKEIVRELHVSRNTVRKVVRSGATALAYEREVQPLPKLGHWRADLDRLLLTNAGKSPRVDLRGRELVDGDGSESRALQNFSETTNRFATRHPIRKSRHRIVGNHVQQRRATAQQAC